MERSVLVREHLNNWYKLKYYYLAKMMADLPFEVGIRTNIIFVYSYLVHSCRVIIINLQIVFTTIYVIILYFMSNHPYDVTRFFKFLTIGILVSLVSQSLGLALGAGLSLKVFSFQMHYFLVMSASHFRL